MSDHTRSTVTGRKSVARSGALALVGALVSAVMGFVLVVVLGRMLGTIGAGVVLQGVAAFTIALGVARAGLDTTAVWLLPRLADEAPEHVRSAVVGLLTVGLGLGIVVGAGLFATGSLVDGPVGAVFSATAWFLPAAALMLIALAATRGLGGVRPYVAINNVVVPTVRPVLVAAVALAGYGAVAAGTVWAVTFVLGAASGLFVLARRVRMLERETRASAGWWPRRGLRGQIRRYTLPRWAAVILEQLMLWLDVLLVGMLAGPSAAGVYGAATRFVAAGRIVSTALRIVVAPLYSRLLARRDTSGVQDLYTTTTTWIVLLSTPVYAMFFTFGATLLSALGPAFREGATTLAVLSAGLVVTLLGGNLQSVVLMSGMSGRVAVFKAVSLVVLVSGMVLLVPRWGIVGGAVAWSLSVTVDTLLAAMTVVRRLRIRVGGRPVALALLVGGFLPTCVAVAVRASRGDNLHGLLVALAVAGILTLMTTWLLRHQLRLDDIVDLVRSRRSVRPAP